MSALFNTLLRSRRWCFDGKVSNGHWKQHDRQKNYCSHRRRSNPLNHGRQTLWASILSNPKCWPLSLKTNFVRIDISSQSLEWRACFRHFFLHQHLVTARCWNKDGIQERHVVIGRLQTQGFNRILLTLKVLHVNSALLKERYYPPAEHLGSDAWGVENRELLHFLMILELTLES